MKEGGRDERTAICSGTPPDEEEKWLPGFSVRTAPGGVFKAASSVFKRCHDAAVAAPPIRRSQAVTGERAMTSARGDPSFRFDRFEIRAAERVLQVDGRVVNVGARAFDVLLALAQRREHLVTKEELLNLVWPGVVVEEHNVATQISALRKLLGPHVIATVPGHGYRFVATPDTPPGEEQVAHSGPRRHNLPEQHTRFIGRDAALADLGRLLPQSRLLTLTGIGGCGKTRLALQFAQQRVGDFRDGVCFVDLAPLSQPERVAAACAAVLLPGGVGEAPTAQRLAQYLAGREVLILLDNCEHVRRAAAAFVNAVLSQPGRTRILATSREPLAIAGEQLYPLSSLSFPATADLDALHATEAVRLFVDRARLLLPEFHVDASNADALVEICKRLDGIALAIELAAARVTMHSVTDIAARLKDRFRLLIGGGSSAARQQTFAATMQWSYDLLEPAERRLFELLSVFAGGGVLASVTAVAQAADEYESLKLLTALHQKSLLVVERGDPSPRPRYRMLESVRQHAQHRLEESGEAGAARQRHAEHFLALAEAAASHVRGPQELQWVARLREEHENLVAAMNWCAVCDDPVVVGRQYGLRLAAATGRYWIFHEVQLGCSLAQRALQCDRDGADSEARFETLVALARMYTHRGRGDDGLPHAQAALAMAQRMQAVERQAMAHNAIGMCLNWADRGQAALRHYEQARGLAQAANSPAALCSALNNIATIEFGQGKLDSAEHGFLRSLRIARAQGDVRRTMIVLENLIRVLVAARKDRDAQACALEFGALLGAAGEDVHKLALLEVVAGLASSRGEHETAARFWGAARQRFDDAGYRRPPEDERHLERLSAASRRALGEVAFERAEAAGRALDLDTAVQQLTRWLEGDP